MLVNLILVETAFAAPPCGENKFLYGSREGMGKKGHANIAKIFDDYKKTRDYDKYLESKSFKKQIEYDALKKKHGENATIVQQFKERARDPLIIDREQFTKEVLQDMRREIPAFAKDNRYGFIMDDRCGKDGSDVTNDIVAFMNAKYEKKGRVDPETRWS
jgi:hypothetical protein